MELLLLLQALQTPGNLQVEEVAAAAAENRREEGQEAAEAVDGPWPAEPSSEPEGAEHQPS